MSSNVASCVRTSLELVITAVNVPKQVEAGQQARDYLAAALFNQDLNTERPETIGISSIVENKFPDDTPVPPYILLPLRFDQRQQLTIRIYSNAKEKYASSAISVEAKLQSVASSMIGEAVFMVSDLFKAGGSESVGLDTMGFRRPLKTSSGSGLVQGLRPMEVALHWRERHYNNRSSKVLATCAIHTGFKPTGINRIAPKPIWRLEATRECIVDARTPEIKSWSQVLSSGKTVTSEDPSWFLDMVSVDALIPEEGESLRVKLWRTEPLHEQRLFGEAFIKRQAILKWIELIEIEEKDNVRKGQGSDRFSIIGATPKPLEAAMHALEDESVVTAQLSLESTKITRAFSLFEFLGSGMRFNMTVAIDVHSSNGDPIEAKSLHHDDPRQIEPSSYLHCMTPVLHFLIPFADKIYPIGFAGHIANQTNSSEMGFFHLSRAKPSGLVESQDELNASYRKALPALKMGKTRYLAPVLSHSIEDASQTSKQSSAPAYSVVIVFTNGVPDDFSQVLKTIQAASHLPISFIFAGIEPGRRTSRLQKTFERLREPPARIVVGRSSESCNVQVVSTAGCTEEQWSLNVQILMKELENQIVAYMKEHRIQPSFVKPLAPAPLPAAVPEPARSVLSHQFSDFVPAVSGVHSAMRILNRKPTLSRKSTFEDATVNDSDTASIESGMVSGVKSRALSREQSIELSSAASPGLSRAPSQSREAGLDPNRPIAPNAVPKEQTELEVQKDKENAANAIRDKYRLGGHRGILEYKARTHLRESIQLKLAVDAYEWKKQMSMVTDTLAEATAPASFQKPHQAQRFQAKGKPPDGMPQTIFNKGANLHRSRARPSVQ